MRMVDGVPWESAVVVRVPALDQPIGSLRRRFDLPLKPNGIPPHITLIVPFLTREELAQAPVMSELRDLCARVEPFSVCFAGTARFPRVLYLAPEPAQPFITLAQALTAHWPQLSSRVTRGGQIVPHLTVTTSRPRRTLDAVDAALAPLLPIRVELDCAQLYLFDGRRWTQDATLAFRY